MSGWDEIIAFGARLESVGANAKVVQDFTLDDPLTGTVEVLKVDLGKQGHCVHCPLYGSPDGLARAGSYHLFFAVGRTIPPDDNKCHLQCGQL